MRESKIERHLKKTVRDLGGECFKWVSPNRHGVSDQLVFLPNGKLYLMECKRPGKELDPHQQRFRKRMGELGWHVYKCDSIDFIDGFFAIFK